MSLFNSMKGLAENAQARSKKLPVRLKAQYYGGYDKYTRKAEGTLYVYVDRVEFITLGLRSFKFSIGKQKIKDVAVEGQDQAGKRITATRLIATGVLAFAWQKKTSQKDTYITVTTTDGQEAIFHIEGKSHMELKPVIAQKIAVASNEPTQQTQASVSVADELTKLAQLKEQGVITQEEFDNKKAQLLS